MFHLQFDTKRSIPQSNFFAFYEILGANLTFLCSQYINNASFSLFCLPSFMDSLICSKN